MIFVGVRVGAADCRPGFAERRGRRSLLIRCYYPTGEVFGNENRCERLLAGGKLQI